MSVNKFQPCFGAKLIDYFNDARLKIIGQLVIMGVCLNCVVYCHLVTSIMANTNISKL